MRINKDNLKIGVTFTPCSKCDREEVVHGEWKIVREENAYDYVEAECSVCGYTDCFDEGAFYNYCPNCGAKMDGGKDA